MSNSLNRHHSPFKQFILVALDLLSICAAFYITSNLRVGVEPDFASLEFTTLATLIIGCLFIGSCYTKKQIGSKPVVPFSTFLVVVTSALPCTVFIYLMGPDRFTHLFGRGILPLAILLIGCLATTNRFVVNKIFKEHTTRVKLLILGNDARKNYFDSSQLQNNITIESKLKSTIKEPIAKHEYDSIVIFPQYHPSEKEQNLLLDARLRGTPIFSASDFYENFFFLIPVSSIDNDWFIRSEGFNMLHSLITIKLKRFFDVLVSGTMLILLSPVVVLCATGIKLSSPGTVFFTQRRVGLSGTPFTIYKLRTMLVEAENEGPKWASEHDTRIFPFGRFLRRSRLDELPQFLNIIKGDMSIIGPRPERPEFTSELSEKIPYYDLRHIVKPGLTGWAQVRYSYGASIGDSLRKLQFDLYYIKNYSLLLDLNIMLRTIQVMLGGKGR